jgi:hypothetical protein
MFLEERRSLKHAQFLHRISNVCTVFCSWIWVFPAFLLTASKNKGHARESVPFVSDDLFIY